MLRTIIVDDEPNARQVIRNILDLYCTQVEVVGEAENVKQGLALLKDKKPDLVILDIRMPDGTGFDLLAKAKGMNFRFIIITAYEQYAIQAIKRSALDYIMKPINANELIEAIEKAVLTENKLENESLKLDNYLHNLQRDAEEHRVVLNTLNSIYAVKIKEIVRCMADKNYTEVFLLNGKHLILSKTLKDFEEMLTEYGFFRTHQSHLINIRFIESYEKGLGGTVVMSDNSKVPVSSRRKELFLKLIGQL
ncbi:MAG: LytTR family DNA-binding domain-containing protein [Bacteroidales bacterium]|jgi:two-component system LytT family response regulator